MKKILVIKLGALGDFIQALGPMRAIRNHHKNDYITLLTTAAFLKMSADCNYFNEVREDKKPKWYQFSEIMNLRRFFRSSCFDRVYDLQNNDRTNLYFKLFDPKPEWVGTAKGASHCNTSPQRIAGHAFDGHVQTLSLSGINNVTTDTLDWMTGDVEKFGIGVPYAILVPGSSKKHPQKRWPAPYYADIAQRLYEDGIVPVLIGGKEDRDVTNTIADLNKNTINLSEKTTLYDIASLARNASVAIGNDTGPMHIITAAKCPTVTIYYTGEGGSDPVRHGTLGARVIKLSADNLDELDPETIFQAIQGF